MSVAGAMSLGEVVTYSGSKQRSSINKQVRAVCIARPKSVMFTVAALLVVTILFLSCLCNEILSLPPVHFPQEFRRTYQDIFREKRS